MANTYHVSVLHITVLIVYLSNLYVYVLFFKNKLHGNNIISELFNMKLLINIIEITRIQKKV